MNWTIKKLRYVAAAAEFGSIAAAARKLNVSAGSISNAINDLEAEFATALFIRKPSQGLTQTPVGRSILLKARAALKTIADFEGAAEGLSNEFLGRLTVAAYEPFAPFFMADIVAGFIAEHPNIIIDMREADLEAIHRMLMEGEIDVGVSYNMPALSAEFEAVELTEVGNYIAMRVDHKLAKKRKLRPEDLDGQSIIALDLPFSLDLLYEIFEARGLELRVRHRSRSYEMVRSMVGAGLGVAILNLPPQHTFTYGGHHLAYRPLLSDIPKNRIQAIYLAQSFGPLPRKTRAFIEDCQKYFQSAPGRSFLKIYQD